MTAAPRLGELALFRRRILLARAGPTTAFEKTADFTVDAAHVKRDVARIMDQANDEAHQVEADLAGAVLTEVALGLRPFGSKLAGHWWRVIDLSSGPLTTPTSAITVARSLAAEMATNVHVNVIVRWGTDVT